jgi:hypothetical protein
MDERDTDNEIHEDLVNPHKRNPQEYEQLRDNRTQVAADRTFHDYVLARIYRAGPNGLSMTKLLDDGIRDGWWQDTARKHWGEKMRALWPYGLIVLPTVPGAKGIKGFRIYHPAWFDAQFRTREAQRRWEDIKREFRDA